MEKDRRGQRQCDQGASAGETKRSTHHNQEIISRLSDLRMAWEHPSGTLWLLRLTADAQCQSGHFVNREANGLNAEFGDDSIAPPLPETVQLASKGKDRCRRI